MEGPVKCFLTNSFHFENVVCVQLTVLWDIFESVNFLNLVVNDD